jgi:hypothetical protein
MDVLSLINSTNEQKRRFGNDLLNNHVPYRSVSGNFLDNNYSVTAGNRYTWDTTDIIPYDQTVVAEAGSSVLLGTISNFIRDVSSVFYGELELEIFNRTAASVGPVTPNLTWREPSVDIAGTGVAFGADVYFGNTTVPAFSRLNISQKTFSILSQAIILNGFGLSMQATCRGVLILGKFAA